MIKKLVPLPAYLLLLAIMACKKEDAAKGGNISVLLPVSQNPAEGWWIGYTPTDTLQLTNLVTSTYCNSADTIALWHAANGQQGYYPYLGQNRGSLTHMDATQSWAAKPFEIVMEASNTGQYSLLQYTVTGAGEYRVKAIFEGVHFNQSTTDVHVLVNQGIVFSGIIEGYGGDSTLHAITGNYPSATYSGTVHLAKGDKLTFAVGYGANKNHYNDTTGLLLEIEKI